MHQCYTFVFGVLLVSIAGISSKSDDASAYYKNEKNLMLWDMANYCISKAKNIYLNDSKGSYSSLAINLRRAKSLPYLEKAKQLILELEENNLLNEPVNEYSVVNLPYLLLGDPKPSDCSDILKTGHAQSGLYTIWPAGKALKAYCDMVTDGGGWTVIQRRGNFSTQENFYRSWDDYENGFGDMTREFWFGNKNIYLMGKQAQYEIRFDLTDASGDRRYAVYKTFYLDDENNFYTLHIGNYSGDAGDSMAYHNNHTFTTKDSKNSKCAKERMSGWWFDYCTECNLNGLNCPGDNNRMGMTWYSWHHHTSLAGSEIKYRRKEPNISGVFESKATP